jgi:hypothetical protein
MNQRTPFPFAGIGHCKARLEIVGSVYGKIVGRDESRGICRRQAQPVKLDLHMRIDAQDCIPRTFRLGLAKRIRTVDDLALQVGERHLVIIDNAECADTRAAFSLRWPAPPISGSTMWRA